MYVVGHTDNVGGYEYNMGLSERRAAAVVKELTAKHGIQSARLKAAGAGPLAPVAPNDSDPGRVLLDRPRVFAGLHRSVQLGRISTGRRWDDHRPPRRARSP